MTPFEHHTSDLIWKAYFEKLPDGRGMRLDRTLDMDTGWYIGYCVSFLSQEKTGENKSIFVGE